MKREWLNWKSVFVAVILVGAFTASQVSAQQTQSTGQTSSTAAQPADKDRIADRKENQQDRIAQGVKSGQLTAGETAHLENKEAKINKETRADRAANGGKLTSAEKTQVNRQQNRLSNKIYKDKHNNRTQHPK
jgi:hypothetical protein